MDLFSGSCFTMCPIQEIKLREREGLLHRFEMSDEKTSKTDKDRAVKTFSRSVVGKNMPDPKVLRPPCVLIYTVKYLLSEVIFFKSSWYTVYGFVEDRLRAVRQDMIIQRTCRSYCIALLQPIVRFYAYAACRLGGEHKSNFDPVLNIRYMNECLKDLLHLYDELEIYNENFPTSVLSKVELQSGIKKEEFRLNYETTRPFMEALYLVLNMGNSEAILRCLFLRRAWRTNTVNKALEISLCFRKGNWKRVCSNIKDLHPLLAGICVTIHLPDIRRRAFQVMSVAYNSKHLTFPADKLASILLYDDVSFLLADLSYYGIAIDKSNNSVVFLKHSFNNEKEVLLSRNEKFTERLRKFNTSALILYGEE